MTRDAMLFLPAKVVEGLLVIACSSLYTHIFTQGAVGTFGIVNTTVQFCYLVVAGWMANAATRYVGEEFRRDRASALFSTVSAIYLLICAAVAAVALFVAGMSLTLMLKGHHIDSEISTNKEMQRRGIKCAVQETREAMQQADCSDTSGLCSGNCAGCDVEHEQK